MHSNSEEFSRNTIHTSIVNAHSDGILAMDSQGVILTANNAIVELFDYPVESLLGKSISYLLPELEGQSLPHYQMLGVCFESAAMHRDGHAVPVEITINLIEDHKQQLFSATIRDNSERKAVEQLRQRVISTLNHQLRTPLTAIKESLDTALNGLAGKLPDKTKHLITVANDNSEQLLSIIDGILNPEHNETEKLSYYFETFNIDDFISTVMAENSPYAQLHDTPLKLSDNVHSGKLFADRARLLQVMCNLIDNAIKSSPNNSQIEINLSKQFDQICIAVTDHGNSPSNTHQPALLSELNDVPSDSTHLGLTVARAIIQKHQAELKHKSNEDGGNTFYFELPLQ